MKVNRQIAIVATFLMAASLTQCKKSPTAPFDTRTYSVPATPVTVPAVPTAPIVIATNDPNSHVQVTLPVATLQAIVQAAGGAATVSMTDLAPTDFGSLPSDEGAKIGSRPLTVLSFSITKSSSAASVASSASGTATLQHHRGASDAGSGGQLHDQFPAGTTCNAGIVLYEINATSSILLSSTFTINAGPPVTATGTTSQLTFNGLTALLDFECPGTVISGASGGSGGD